MTSVCPVVKSNGVVSESRKFQEDAMDEDAVHMGWSGGSSLIGVDEVDDEYLAKLVEVSQQVEEIRLAATHENQGLDSSGRKTET